MKITEAVTNAVLDTSTILRALGEGACLAFVAAIFCAALWSALNLLGYLA